jgi:isocitrate lyase
MKKRDYDPQIVEKLRGSRHYVNQFALHQAQNFRAMLRDYDYVNTFGAYNGQQAVQHVKAGLKAIYCSGWQVAAAANSTQEVYPDQSLYAVNSVPDVVRSINNAFKRQDQISYLESGQGVSLRSHHR